jgi:hypothetical protein
LRERIASGDDRRMHRAALTLAGGLALAGCADPGTAVTVAAYREPCGTQRLCYRYYDDPRQPHTTLPDAIYHFEFEWGIEQDIRYRDFDAEDSLAYCLGRSGACFDVIAVDARRRQPVGTRFTLYYLSPLPEARWFSGDASGLTMVDTQVAASPELATQILDLDGSTALYQIEFEFTGDAAVPIRALTVSAR